MRLDMHGGPGSPQLSPAYIDLAIPKREDRVRSEPQSYLLGNETINNFAPHRDVIEFNHALFVNFIAVMADAKQVGQDTIITHDPNNIVVLHDVAASSLQSNNFKFA